MKRTWDKAMSVAKAMCEGQEVSEEQLEIFAKKIMGYDDATTDTSENYTESQEDIQIVKNNTDDGEIAKGEFQEDNIIIGSGIVAEPEEEKKVNEEEDFIIRFQKPYHFEGKTYAGVDLSGLKSLRAKDVWKINRNYRNAGNIGLLQEMDSEYTARVAARASGMPVEFFECMELPDMIKVRTKVSDFFYPRE